MPDVDVRTFVEAFHDPLSRQCMLAQCKLKQSVSDCERMFSSGLLGFMEGNGKTSTGCFAHLVNNWHKASDGRCLISFDFMPEDWMPWYHYNRDYSTMDVNR